MTKVAYITGGSKGIGLGIAEAMLAENWKVAITGRNKKSLEEFQAFLTNQINLLLNNRGCQRVGFVNKCIT